MQSLAYQPDGRRLVTTDESGAIHVWRTTLDKRAADGTSYAAFVRGYGSAARGVALTADGFRLASRSTTAPSRSTTSPAPASR